MGIPLWTCSTPCPEARVYARYVHNGVVIVGLAGERDVSDALNAQEGCRNFLSTGRRYSGCHRKNYLAPLEIGSYADIVSSRALGLRRSNTGTRGNSEK